MAHLERLCQGHDLSTTQAKEIFHEILEGKLNDIDISSLLIALKAKGEATSEILGAVSALRETAIPFPCLRQLKESDNIVDCVGTGGDNQHSLNISTPSAIMAAALGLKIAKHGNRAVSSSCGTADLLEGVGIQILMTPDVAKRTLIKTGFTFLFAPHYHPAVNQIKDIRKRLKTRTLFNLIGPLLNPALPDILLVGVYHPSLCLRLAKVLQSQGVKRALVVHGQGLDEIALHGPTTGILLNDGILTDFTLTPEQVGITRSPIAALRGGDLAFNRQHFLDLLQGKGTIAYRNAVALNTGALLWLNEKVSSLKEGVEQTLAALNTDIGYQCLLNIKEASHAQ